MAQPGKKNEAETASSLRLLKEIYGDGVYWYRLYDGAQVRKIINLLTKINLDPKTRSQINQIAKYATYIKQPADFFLMFNGIDYFLEDKSSKNPRRYTFNYVADHQVEDLINIEKAGGNGIFMFTNRAEPRHYHRYAIRASDYKILRDKYLKEGVKSCMWNDFEEIGIEIPRLKGSNWDLEILFEL